MFRIILLSSAAITLTGCSLIDGSAFSHSDAHSHQHASPYNHGSCESTNCVPGSSYSVSNEPTAYYGQEAHQGYAPNDYGYGQPQQPSTQAYGSQVQGYAEQGHAAYGHQDQSYPAYGGHTESYGQAYGQGPQLRGPQRPNRQQAYLYGTLGVVAYDVGSDIYGLQGRLGYQSGRFIGAEVEGSFGVIDEKDTVGAVELEAGIDYSLAAFARAVVPLGQRFNVFGRAGYHATEIRGSATDATGTVEFSDSTDGFAYGAGAEYAFTPRDSLRLDYTRYDLGPGDIESLALAYARKF